MPPALTYSDDDGAGDDGLFAAKEYKPSTQGNISNGAGRTTRANTASNNKPGTALALTGAAAPIGNLYNDEDDDEEEYEDDDDDTADPDSGSFLSKPKLPTHQYASRSLSDITRKYSCYEILAGCSYPLCWV